jgi:enamine deaminase RidA (YjgF/YER057c/UK114 family)
MSIEEKLQELGIELPTPPTPQGSYTPVVRTGNLCFISGQLPMQDGQLKAIGSVPDKCEMDRAIEGARICAINILAQLKAQIGSLDKIKKIVRLNGYVQSESGFYNHAQVLNGASDFLAEVLGEKGIHTRVAIGVYELPLNASMEIDAIIEVE